jgi:hypothetical protein
MALSDLILQLGSQAKDLEDSASALRGDNDAKLKARASELHESLSKIKVAVGQKLDSDSDAAATRWAGLQRTVSDGFEALRSEAAARTVDPAAQADTVAGRAQLDAQDAIDFAVHALQEAEYYLLAAVAARGDDRDLTEVELDGVDGDEQVSTDGDVLVDEVVVTDGAIAADDTVATDGATAEEEPAK